ncbi:MAG: Y-family DNA polymerase [Hymenobacter sp.]|nr:MAG: Y-family DNA polymerase [Hymenobacter sp.]
MFGLVDCNNFYCSCKRVFQNQLQGKPLIVLSNNDGCAIARSEEAKALGVQMGENYHELYPLIKRHNIQVRSSNYTLYDNMSGRVMRTIGRFVPNLEVYSIDEAFIDLFGMARHHNLEQLCQTIRGTIGQNQNIPVCIGVAPTKTLAKLANHYAKKVCREEGVYVANTPEKIQAMLEWAPLKEVWGLGKQYCKLLTGYGYHTAAQLLAAPEDFVRKHLTVVGARLLNELKGIACIPWEYEEADKKGICSSRSFGKMMNEKKYVQHAVAEFASRVAEKLRLQGSVTKKIHVFVNTNPHRADHAQHHQGVTYELLMAASDTPTLVKAALTALDMIWRDNFWYMKAAVMATDVCSKDAVQTSLWEPPDKSKLNAAMAALDGINKTYFKHMVRIASMGPAAKAYETRHAHLSKCYTTRLSDVLTTSF